MREVTERDLRHPNFSEGGPEDYEFRDDGKIVRKDRWERGLRDIGGLMLGSRSNFEIPDVVKAVRDLLAQRKDPRTARQIVDQTEELARGFAEMEGYTLEGDFRSSTAPRAQGLWKLACLAQEVLTYTDVQNAVDDLEE